MKGIPETIKAGYPEKEFKFTGKWIKQYQGYYRAARNKRAVLIPEYRADDGEIILSVEYAVNDTLENIRPLLRG